MQSSRHARITAQIVAAYVSNNHIARPDVARVVEMVVGTLDQLSGAGVEVAEPEPLVPAVSVRKSIEPDYIICLEDGKRFRSLKRHLATKFGLSPDEYRRKWGLPSDYPMVAPNYAAARSEMAKSMGLGRKAANAAPAPEIAEPATPPVVEAPAKAKGRPGRKPRQAAPTAAVSRDEAAEVQPRKRATRKAKTAA